VKQFGELDDFLGGDAEPGLVLTIGGSIYTVLPPSAEVGLWCQRIAAAAGQLKTATTQSAAQAAADRLEALPGLDDGLTLPERLLGETHTQMVTDGVDHSRVRIAAMTVLLWIVSGDEAAEAFWSAGGRPEALAPANRGERRRRSTTTAAAPTTRRRASGSGTSRQSTSARNARKKAGQ